MNYSKHYSEESWIKKIRSLPGKSATDLMDKAITLRSAEVFIHASLGKSCYYFAVLWVLWQ